MDPANLMTKYSSSEIIDAHGRRLGADFKTGRAATAPIPSGWLAYWQLGGNEVEDPEENWLLGIQQIFEH